MFDDDFFDDFSEWFFKSSGFEPESEMPSRSYSSYVSPVYDVWENKSNVFVTIELPGVREKDIELEISQYRLFVKAERQKKREDFEGYYRTIRLPSMVKEKPVSRTFKNGVLELIFEKSEDKKPRIEVK